MSSPVGREPAGPPVAWIVVAHVLGAAAIGGLDAARLRAPGIALAVIPVAAATGLLFGLAAAGVGRGVATWRPWRAALALAAPSLLVTIPVARTLFDGAYAQTLPLAREAPVLAPLALWGLAAALLVLGRWLLRAGDLTSRAIAVLALAGAAGGLVWVERHVLRTGYATAHLGGTVAVLFLLGLAIRVTRRGTVPALAALALAGLVVGTAAAAARYGLAAPTDRARLVTFGDQARDLVRIWRAAADLDRDGASPLLGGGDCDDLDAARHPGAIDVPGDGVDQDCDGADATAAPPAPPSHAAADRAAWRATPAVQAVLARTRSMDVVLVTVDALRYDLLAPGAPDRGDFPHLAALLDDSILFTHAIAPAAGTDVSLSTLLTGRFDPFQRVAVTLPEAMRGLGLRTYAAIPGEVTRYVGEILPARGIDHFTTVHTDWQVRDVGDHVSAGATTAAGLAALDDAAGRRAFVWLHYFDVHEHHQIDPPRALLAAVHDGGSPVAHRYRALLRAIDTSVGHLLDGLAARHLADRTIVVFASDHGESLGEDPRLPDTHGGVTYAPLVRIPLAIHIPGVPGARRDDLVSLVDLAPTLLDLLAAPPGAIPALDGTDLVPALLAAPAALRPAHRAVAIHEQLQWAIVEWPYQLIVRPSDDLVELYDLERDPGEHDNLAARRPELVSRLRARYAAFPPVVIDRTPSGRSAREQQARPPQARAPR